MTVLVAAETLLLILLAVVVVALLRSHAEILRRLEALGGGGGAAARGREVTLTGPESSPRRDGAIAAPDVAGAGLDGLGVQIGMAPGNPSTLVAFLTSGCMTCMEFWRSFSEAPPELPEGGRLVIVTKNGSHESPSKLRRLAPAGIPLVMSTDAWERYEVPAAPYFVWVDGASGEIHGEGAASAWEQVASLLADAIDDVAGYGSSGPERSARIDDELARAGISPGHPSLYPGREDGLTEPEG
jgi:hypothetical protein